MRIEQINSTTPHSAVKESSHSGSSKENNMENSTPRTTAQEQSWSEYSIIWAIVSLILLSIILDILILFNIKRTRTLMSYTGDLLLSQVSSCIHRQLLSLSLILTYRGVQGDGSLHTARYAMRLLLTGFQGITSHTLAAISLNLYLTVCYSNLYRTRMSRVYVLVFIPVCWIINICVALCPLASRDPIFVSIDIVQVPSYGGSALWSWLFIIFFVYIIPAALTAFAFVKIVSHSLKIRPLSSINVQFRAKYHLTKAVVGLATCYISLWSLMHLLRALQTKYDSEESGKTTFRDLAAIPYFLNLFYDAFKLGVFMLIYKPFRETVTGLCRRRRRRRGETSRMTTVEDLTRQDVSTTHV